MLCEGRLLRMTYGEFEVDSPQKTVTSAAASSESDISRQRQTSFIHPITSGRHDTGVPIHRPTISPLQSLDVEQAWPDRHISPEIEIPAQVHSTGEGPFLVPSFCQSICQNYSDLHIAGDQVLPLSANVQDYTIPNKLKMAGPFLQSFDVLPPVEESQPGKSTQNEVCFPKRGSNQWRQGSGRDRSFFLQGREGPFSNSLLNHYLEQKLQDLYQQYIMDNMAKKDSNPDPLCPLLGSEMVMTSLDQITLQLSRDGNLEAGVAKDMVLSCLLRVAGDMQSSEISTPFLQISNEGATSTEQLVDNKEQ